MMIPAILTALRAASEASWLTCIVTSDIEDPSGERRAEASQASEACLEAWDRAIAAAARTDGGAARELETARQIAKGWGDDSEERRGLAVFAILELARQDQAGETEASGSPLDRIRAWRAGGAEAGDTETVLAIDRLGAVLAAEIYASSFHGRPDSP